MSQPRRPPKAPSPPRPPRIRPVRLQPIRSGESVALDAARARGGDALPPFVRFDHFIAGWEWERGEHVTTIGPTGSGKTVLNRELLKHAPIPWIVVLGVKQRDPELYQPFQRMGYELVRRFDPEPPDNADSARILFVPRTDKQGAEGRMVKARAFRSALNDIQDTGNWVVYADDIQYMADQMKLAPDFEELWILGRSEGVSVVASSQEPVNIPVMAYGMATHLFLFKNPDKRRAERMAELTGINRVVAQEAVMRLPEHEFLYINKRTGQMMRSKVLRRR